MTQCWWLYLLECRDGRTYAGIATDVEARFAAHSSGKGAKFTRSNPPVRVLGIQSFATRSEALKAEAALKKLDRPRRLDWAQSRVEHSAAEPNRPIAPVSVKKSSPKSGRSRRPLRISA